MAVQHHRGEQSADLLEWELEEAPAATSSMDKSTKLYSSPQVFNDDTSSLSDCEDAVLHTSDDETSAVDRPKSSSKTSNLPTSGKASASLSSKSAGKSPQTRLSTSDDQFHDPNIDPHSIRDLYYLTVRTLAASRPLVECTHCLHSSIESSLERQLTLMYLWAQGVDLKFLQAAVDQSTQLQTTIARELLGIIKSVQKLSRGQTPNSKDKLVVPDVHAYVRRFREATIDAGASSDSSSTESDGTDDGTASEQDALSKSDHSNHRTSFRRLKMHVKCLMDLSPTLVHCCNEERAKSGHREAPAPTQTSQVFQIIQPYVLQVQDKFPSIDLGLATRLGEANWNRFKRLQSLAASNRARQEGLDESSSEGEELQALTFRPTSEFQDSGLGASLPTKSRFTPSVVSHTSFLSTASAASLGAARVPPTPTEVEQGVPFVCLVCGLTLSSIRNRIDWKMHIFADIQPYICTAGGCRDSRITFPTRASWAEHEFDHHRARRVWRCFRCSHELNSEDEFSIHLDTTHADKVPASTFERKAIFEAAKTSVISSDNLDCPICPKTEFKTQRQWATHVGKHMEEIALIVVPRTVDSDEDGDEGKDEELIKSHGSESSAEASSVNIIINVDGGRVSPSVWEAPRFLFSRNENKDDDDRAGRSSRTSEPQQLFACPYNKFDPRRFSSRNTAEKNYRGCGSTYLTDIARLKQHLKRVHWQPEAFCPRCFDEFKNAAVLAEHTTRDTCVAREECPFAEKMDKTQQDKIHVKRPRVLPDTVWFDIYKVLFPGSQLPDSPYNEVLEEMFDVDPYKHIDL